MSATEPVTYEQTSETADGEPNGNGSDDGDGHEGDDTRRRAEQAARTRIAETARIAEESGWYGAWMLVRKEIARFWNIAGQTVISPVVTTMLYFMVFDISLGGPGREVLGVPYVDFLVPGLIMLSLINNAFLNSSFSFFITKIHGTLVDILVTPLTPAQLTVGYTAASIVRGTMIGFIIWVVAALMGAGTISSPVIAVGFMVATALAFASLGLAVAILAEDFDHINLLPNFLITPLIFLGGVFYSIQTLPEPWETVSRFNPVLYLVNGIRYGMTGVSDVPMWQAYSVAGSMIVVFTAAAIIMLNYGTKIRQ